MRLPCHATRTRFKYPPYQTTEDQENDPESLLFYGGLIRSRPRAWIKGWVMAGANGDPGDKPKLRDDLRQRYFRHLLSETYLVAAKTADKLRYLEPAQSLLAISLRFLFLRLLFLAPIDIFVPSTKPPAQPTKVTLSQESLLSALPARPAENVTPGGKNAPSEGTEVRHP